jgi:mono/diheme cytochrome c family protein
MKISLIGLALALFMLASFVANSATQPPGEDARKEVQAGAQVYSATCASCHGSKLQGGAAPALTGPLFAKSLETNFSTADKLFKFIATLMPVNNPGSLSTTQYTDVLSFILASNNYPTADAPLDVSHNLVFMGEGDGHFDAFDATTGSKLWSFNLGAGVNAPPVTYAVNGVQYVAVAAGGNFQMGFPYGDTIAIFSLQTVGAHK